MLLNIVNIASYVVHRTVTLCHVKEQEGVRWASFLKTALRRAEDTGVRNPPPFWPGVQHPQTN